MDIILLERIEKLGSIGDVVSVKDGYARNFLLPNKKALRANDANRKVFEANRERLEAENAARRGEAAKSGEKIDGAEVVLIRASSNSGQLYGSVSVRVPPSASVWSDGAGASPTRVSRRAPTPKLETAEANSTGVVAPARNSSWSCWAPVSASSSDSYSACAHASPSWASACSGASTRSGAMVAPPAVRVKCR